MGRHRRLRPWMLVLSRMRRVLVALILMSLSGVRSHAQITDVLKFDIHAVDQIADPCTDFYQYACGNWLKRNPIPADRSYSAVFQQMRDINQKRVAEILQQAAASPAKDDQQIGDYYASCMDA